GWVALIRRGLDAIDRKSDDQHRITAKGITIRPENDSAVALDERSQGVCRAGTRPSLGRREADRSGSLFLSANGSFLLRHATAGYVRARQATKPQGSWTLTLSRRSTHLYSDHASFFCEIRVRPRGGCVCDDGVCQGTECARFDAVPGRRRNAGRA